MVVSKKSYGIRANAIKSLDIGWVGFVDGMVSIEVGWVGFVMDGGIESDGWLVEIENIDKFWEGGPSMMPNNKYIIQIPQIDQWIIWIFF